MPRKTVTIGDRTLALDARFDRLDLRDLPYRPRLGNLPTQYPSDEDAARWLPAYVAADLVRNQGPDGACTGFGLAAVINYLLFTKPRTDGMAPRQVSPAMLYRLARLYDEWPGEDYDGSSCRGALKGWQRHGVCRDGLWPYVVRRNKRIAEPPLEASDNRDDPERNWDVDALDCTLGVYFRVDARSIVDMQSAIAEVGAIYVAGVAHEGWNVPARKTLRGHADLVRIQHVPKPRDGGGHAFALVGYNDLGFVLQNSWGPEWASQGFALLPYEDWVTHGEDAWVFTLGVPRRMAAEGKRAGHDRALRSPRFLVPSASRDARGLERPMGMLRGDDAYARRFRDIPAELQPLDTNAAYCHTIMLDRGYAVGNELTTAEPGAAVHNAACERPRAWLKQRRRKIMIFAQGGLHSEGASITRVRALAPYALAHGIYPLFITWRSGALETIGDLVEEQLAKGSGAQPTRAGGWADRLSEKTDRQLEPLLRGPGSALWGQLKLNAQRASRFAEGGAFMMVRRLEALAQVVDDLELHLIGHSAGAILLGAMLEPLRRAKLKVKTLRLFAPSCTTRFALEHFQPSLRNRQIEAKHLYVHTLSDKLERDDRVGPYSKSLLYLVSRAFEDVHKTPLLGLDRSFDAETAEDGHADDLWSDDRIEDVRQWTAFWDKSGVPENRIVQTRPTVSTGGGSIDATHSCFDRAVDIMGDALGTIVNPRSPDRVVIHRLDD